MTRSLNYFHVSLTDRKPTAFLSSGRCGIHVWINTNKHNLSKLRLFVMCRFQITEVPLSSFTLFNYFPTNVYVNYSHDTGALLNVFATTWRQHKQVSVFLSSDIPFFSVSQTWHVSNTNDMAYVRRQFSQKPFNKHFAAVSVFVKPG